MRVVRGTMEYLTLATMAVRAPTGWAPSNPAVNERCRASGSSTLTSLRRGVATSQLTPACRSAARELVLMPASMETSVSLSVPSADPPTNRPRWEADTDAVLTSSVAATLLGVRTLSPAAAPNPMPPRPRPRYGPFAPTYVLSAG